MTSNTASASVRQLVCVVFERVAVEKTSGKPLVTDFDRSIAISTVWEIIDGTRDCISPTKRYHKKSPRNLDPSTLDAYLLFQVVKFLFNSVLYSRSVTESG